MTDTSTGATASTGLDSRHSRGFFFYSCAVLAVAVLLIWWGAATTTEQAGMAFPDWPLSFGSINPDGWLEHMIPFLEHSHRLLATVVGLLVLGQFSWAFLGDRASRGKRLLELLGIVLLLALVFGLFIRAGAERELAERKREHLFLATAVGTLPWIWWFRGCLGRKWNVTEKLTSLALLLVTVQAILGGLRVTEISDRFAVIHGCLAQFFFCLLVLIVLRASAGWRDIPFLTTGRDRTALRWGGIILLLLVSGQLVFGASMRHHHRFGLADDGILLTAGEWIPPLHDANLALMFLHKSTAVLVLLAMLGLFGWAMSRKFELIGASRHLLLVIVLVAAQIGLGILVVHTGKSFWITNFHVLNGLGILALVFVFAVRSVLGKARLELLADGTAGT